MVSPDVQELMMQNELHFLLVECFLRKDYGGFAPAYCQWNSHFRMAIYINPFIYAEFPAQFLVES